MKKSQQLDPLFGRTDVKKNKCVNLRLRARREAVARLCDNADFRAWLFDTLDDLCLLSRDEGLVTEFGQGIRAAARRIQNRLLETKEAIAVLTEFMSKEFAAYHAGVVAAQKTQSENKI